MTSNSFIDVRIPWEPEKALGFAYNRAMKTVEDWVLFIDHDVLLDLHGDWYARCQRAIKQVGDKAGIISCMTNAIGCPIQRATMDKTMDLAFHIQKAKELADHYGDEIFDVTDAQWKLSGFFMLTRKSVWEKTGPFPDNKFIGADNWYHDRVKENGYRIYIIPGLYVYHGYCRFWKG